MKKRRNKNFCENITAMGTYCVSCKTNTANENSSVKKTKQDRLIFLSNCAVCDMKK